MKKLLLLICFLNLTAAAQDSTSISFGTETVQDFRKQSLMDEYDRAFGQSKKVNTRLKIGIMDYGILPFIGLEQRIGKRWNLNLGGMIRTYSVGGSYRFDLLQKDAKLRISPYAEIKYYLRPNVALSGNYVAIEYRDINETPVSFLRDMGLNFPYFSKNQFSLNLGKQFGSSVDIGIQIGLKNAARTEVGEDGFLRYNSKPDQPFILFAGTYSKIGIGKDLPWKRGDNTASCDFLNCYNEFKSLFKINLSNILHADPFYKGAKLDFSYERKLGKLPISFDLGLVSGIGSSKRFKETGEKGPRPEPNYIGDFAKYSDTYISSLTINSTATLQLRYYVLQNRNIAKGKSVSNLSGFYTGIFSSGILMFNNFYNPDGKLEKFSRYDFAQGSGFMVGIQKKVLKNYYYDFSMSHGLRGYKNQPIYTGLVQNIKFGYAF